MAYIKNNWVDREGTTRYFKTIEDDGAEIFTPDYSKVTEIGTPVNADNMNHIEEGIAGCDLRKHNLTETYVKGEWVTGVVEDVKGIYESLTDNNYSNPLTDTTKWQKVELGGGGSGFNLFDLVIKDHILTYEESKGFALQGTYVYKTPVAGSRYGYPDFYAKCLEEYQNSTLTGTFNYEQLLNPDEITSSGTWSNVNNAFDGSSSTYATVKDTTSYIEWDLGRDLYIEGFTATGLWVSGAAQGVNLSIYSVDSSGNEMLLGTSTGLSDESSPYTLTCNFAPVVCNKIRFKSATTIHSSVPPRIAEINLIAKMPLHVNSNGHIYYDIADKTAIDAWFDTYGIADFYGIDEENERVFLPRNNWFMQLTTDASKVNQFNEAGLPNITGWVNGNGLTNGSKNESGGAFYKDSTHTGGSANYGGSGNSGFGFDASRSNSIYGKSTTVQPASSNKLLYYVVGNTEVTSSVTDVVDITTSENDTVPLFTGMYFDFKPNNLSWLKAGGQANNAGIYESTYNTLVNCLNGTNPYNLKVVEESAMVSGTDYSEYWKVNQDGMYFVTPTKISYLPINADTAPVVGNGMTLGLTNGTDNAGLIHRTTQPYHLGADGSAYGVDVGTSASGSAILGASDSIGITTDPSKSGIVADLASAKSTTAQLYFKVANAVENLELLNVGEVMEALSDKIGRQECKAYITETYVNGTSGYRVWSDGYCEQWGWVENTPIIITFLKKFKDTNYNCQGSEKHGDNVTRAIKFTTETTGSIRIVGSDNPICVSWIVRGYLAEGEY